MQIGIPIFYFPVKILFVDDDTTLLRHLRRCRQINLPHQIKHLICTAAR